MRALAVFVLAASLTLSGACRRKTPDMVGTAGGDDRVVVPGAGAGDAGEIGPAAIALFRDAPAEYLRGRLVDSALGQPASSLWVRLESEDQVLVTQAVDTGHFLAPGPLPDGELRVAIGLDSEGPWRVAQDVLDHSAREAQLVVHVVQVAPGPTYELDFLELAADEPTRWEGRLVERDSHGNYRSWSWQVLRPGALPRLAYLDAEQPVTRGFSAVVEVRQRGKDWFARARVPSTRGVHWQPISMQLVQYAGFGGLLTAVEGRPVAGAELSLIQESGSETPRFYDGPRFAWSDAEGRFRFSQGLEPGGYHLQVRSEGRADVQLDLELESGELEGYELRLSAVEAREQLAVAVVGDDGAGAPEALVSLRSIDGAGVRRVLHTRQTSSARDFVELAGSGCAMLFGELPPGRYEAAAFGADGRRYEPAVVELELPFDAEGLAFVALGDPPRALRFDVRAAAEGPLASHRVRLAGERWWFPEAAEVLAGEVLGAVASGGATTRWTVFADGFRPVHGSLSDLRPLDDASWRPVEVDLQPGWGCELCLRDGSAGLPHPELDSWQRAAYAFQAAPLAGVSVLADGVELGASDADGRLRLSLAAPPRTLEFRKEGWRILDARAAGGDGGGEIEALGRAGGAVLWMRRSH